MKNKNGFTLVELLAVVVILMIIVLLAFPNFYTISNSYRSKYDATTRILLKNAASMYVNNNIDDVRKEIQANGSLCLPIGKLIAYEYLESDLKDSSGEINKNRCITVRKTYSDGKEKFEYDLNTNTVATNDFYPPIVYITSKNKEVYECGQTMDITRNQFNQSAGEKATDKFISFIETNCTIGVSDNVDLNIEPKAAISTNSNDTRFFIRYEAVDSSGNKALPLKVEVRIKQ